MAKPSHQNKGFFRKVVDLKKDHPDLTFAICACIAATIFITSLVVTAPVAPLMLMLEIGSYLAFGLVGMLFGLHKSSKALLIGLTLAAVITSLMFPPVGLATLGLCVALTSGLVVNLLWAGICDLDALLEKPANNCSNQDSEDCDPSSHQIIATKMPIIEFAKESDDILLNHQEKVSSSHQSCTAISALDDTDRDYRLRSRTI